VSKNTRAYYEQHEHCPFCGQGGLERTTIGVIEIPGQEFTDTANTAICPRCRWMGKVHEMVASPCDARLCRD